MSAAQHPVRVELEPRQSRLRQVLWVWLLTGGMLILLGPMRGQSLWFGWLPFWAVVWPGLSLTLLRLLGLAHPQVNAVSRNQGQLVVAPRSRRNTPLRSTARRKASPRTLKHLKPA